MQKYEVNEDEVWQDKMEFLREIQECGRMFLTFYLRYKHLFHKVVKCIKVGVQVPLQCHPYSSRQNASPTFLVKPKCLQLWPSARQAIQQSPVDYVIDPSGMHPKCEWVCCKWVRNLEPYWDWWFYRVIQHVAECRQHVIFRNPNLQPFLFQVNRNKSTLPPQRLIPLPVVPASFATNVQNQSLLCKHATCEQAGGCCSHLWMLVYSGCLGIAQLNTVIWRAQMNVKEHPHKVIRSGRVHEILLTR